LSGDRARLAHRTLVAALAGNIISVVIKLFFGILANSIAMVADAIHSILDSSSSIIGMYGNKISAKPPDLDHPYGHGKYEYIAALGITTMMFVAGYSIIREAIERIMGGIIPNITFYSFIAITSSMVISLAVSIYERKVGKRLTSSILLADSFHSLTDVFASVVVIAGFIGLGTGLSYADSLAAILVCLIIAYAGLRLFRENVGSLVDRGVDRSIISRIEKVSCGMDESVNCHSVRGKVVGNKIFIDMHLTVKSDTSVEEAHRIAEILERKLKKEIEGTEEVIVHVEPQDRQEDRH